MAKPTKRSWSSLHSKALTELKHYVRALETENLTLQRKLANERAKRLTAENYVKILDDPNGQLDVKKLTDAQLDVLISRNSVPRRKG